MQDAGWTGYQEKDSESFEEFLADPEKAKLLVAALADVKKRGDKKLRPTPKEALGVSESDDGSEICRLGFDLFDSC